MYIFIIILHRDSHSTKELQLSLIKDKRLIIFNVLYTSYILESLFSYPRVVREQPRSLKNFRFSY